MIAFVNVPGVYTLTYGLDTVHANDPSGLLYSRPTTHESHSREGETRSGGSVGARSRGPTDEGGFFCVTDVNGGHGKAILPTSQGLQLVRRLETTTLR